MARYRIQLHWLSTSMRQLFLTKPRLDPLRSEEMIWIIGSIILYATSLTQVDFSLAKMNGWPGWAIPLLGLTGAASGKLANLVWLANPLIICSWTATFKRKRELGVLLSMLACGIALACLFWDTVRVSEGGNATSVIRGYGPGYWFWLGSIGSNTIGAMLCCLASRRDPWLV